MKLTKFIKKLQSLQRKLGDVEVHVMEPSSDEYNHTDAKPVWFEHEDAEGVITKSVLVTDEETICSLEPLS